MRVYVTRGVDVREETIEIVDKITIQKAWLGNRTRDSSAMNATETVTETARNTNPIGALRRTSNANVVFTGRARLVKRIGSVKTPRTVDVAETTNRSKRKA